MATELDAMTLETVAHAVCELGVSQAPTGPASNNVNVEKVPDLCVQGCDMNTPGKDVVVQNLNGLETLGSAGPHVALSKPHGNEVSLGVDTQDSLPRNGKPSEEINGYVTAVAGESDGEERGLEDFSIEAMMEMDAELGYPDNADYMEQHGFSVGDLVWGKIRSHPWWPGQIYNPSDASSEANKYNQKDRHLVAFYGDGSFSWCLPSQLIPFAEHFEEMSKQSSLKAFIGAVKQAVDEIGRLVEHEMTCSCVSDENRRGLTRPLAVNAGIRSGVLVPEGDIGKLLSFRYDPSEVLATVSGIAESVSFASTLELSILKGWLSAFYRARGGFTLPLYYEPVFVMGLDDSGRSNGEEGNDCSVLIEVPLQDPLKEDWLSPATAGLGHVSHSDDISHRRRQESVADLTKGTDVIPKSHELITCSEVADASNFVSGKRKSDNSVQASPMGRWQESVADGVLHREQRSLSSALQNADISGGESTIGEGAKGSDGRSSPRERRKSKYLSPPYTIPTAKAGYPSYELGTESEEDAKFGRVGERVKMAAEQILQSSPSINHVGTTAKKPSSEKCSIHQTAISAELLPQPGGQYQNKIIGDVDAIASENDVLSALLSVATSPLRPWNAEMLKLTREFFYAFRSSVCLSGANYKMYHRRQPGSSRNLLNSEDENPVDNLNRTEETGAKKRKEKLSASKRRTADMSYTPKRKKVARVSAKDANSMGLEKNASLTSSFALTVAPGFTFPSKDEIIRIFSKYGHINKEETDVFSDSCYVKIVHVNIAGAEAALREISRQNPYGCATVEYKICYSSAAPAAVSSDKAVASDGISQLGSNAQT